MKRFLALVFVFLAAGFALEVSAPSLVTVTQGRTADVSLGFYNNYYFADLVFVSFSSTSSTLPVLPTLSDSAVTVYSYSWKNVTLTIDAAGANPGTYAVQLFVSHTAGSGTFSKNITVEVRAPVRITPAYSGILTAQGEFEYLKYSVQNLDSVTRSMIIDCSPIAAEFDAACPPAFSVAPGGVREVSVGIIVPAAHPAGEYEASVRLSSGEFSVLSNPTVLAIQEAPVAAQLEVTKSTIRVAESEDGRGYNVTLSLKAARDFKNLAAAGLPSNWEIKDGVTNISKGDSVFSFLVVPPDFDEHRLELVLAEDGFTAASVPLAFSGTAAGITGFAIGDGSITVGVLLVVIVALVLLYVRLRGRLFEAQDEAKTVKYFEGLLEKARKELAGEAGGKPGDGDEKGETKGQPEDTGFLKEKGEDKKPRKPKKGFFLPRL